MSRAAPERPARPAVPLAIWCLAGVMCSEQLVLSWGFDADVHACNVIGLVSLAMALVLSAAMIALRDCVHEARRSAAVIVIACMMGCSQAAFVGGRQQEALFRLSHEAVSGWELLIESDCRPSDYGYSCRARIAKKEASAEVWLTVPSSMSRGSSIVCVGRFRPPADDEFGRTSWRQGVVGSVRALRIQEERAPSGVSGWLERLRTRLVEAFDPRRNGVRALMAGCTCGYRVALDEQGLVDDFSTLGIAHLIAVSGSHLSLVCTLVARLLESGRLDLRLRLPLLAIASGFFVLFCGAPISAVRAWVMSLAASGAEALGRRGHALSAVGMVGLCLSLAAPPVSGQLGFVLSVTSVVGLSLLSSHATYALRVLVPDPYVARLVGGGGQRALAKVLAAVRQMLAATIVCQLVTMPMTAKSFGRVSLIAPVTNILFGPIVSLLTGVGLVCCLAEPIRPVQQSLLGATDLLNTPLLEMLQRMARMPAASVSSESLGPVPGLLTVLVAVVWLAWWPVVNRRKALRLAQGLLAIALLVVVRWRYLSPARIVVLDVGQGDAILVQDGASAILVDAGPDDAVVSALGRLHVLHLDAVVVTHLHDDHFGGIASLVGTVPCESVLVARGVTSHLGPDLDKSCRDLTGDCAHEVGYHDSMHVGRFSLEVIWPRSAVDGTVNADSLELLVDFRAGGRRMSALLTGDAERDETGSCIEVGDVGDVDLLKVGHHGSEVSLTPEEVRVLSPEVAVASAGEGNSYGHPRPECVGMLEDEGSLFFCTKDVGDVDVRPGSDGIEVRCHHVYKAEGLSLVQAV